MVELRIIVKVFNHDPKDESKFCADVYLNGSQISWGAPGQTKEEAIKAAGESIIENADLISAGKL